MDPHNHQPYTNPTHITTIFHIIQKTSDQQTKKTRDNWQGIYVCVNGKLRRLNLFKLEATYLLDIQLDILSLIGLSVYIYLFFYWIILAIKIFQF